MNKDPVFIIKCMKKEYVSTLTIDNSFFALPAAFYWNIERGKGDKDEALCSLGPWNPTSSGMQVKEARMGYDVPIFCCYVVDRSEVQEDIVYVNRCFIDEFLRDDCTAVMFSYTDFLSSIESCAQVQYHGRVRYYDEITPSLEIEMMSRGGKPLLYKNQDFAYQKEYRIAFRDSIKPRLKETESGGGELYYIEADGKPYRFDKVLLPLAKLSKNSFLEIDEENYGIRISDLS